MSEIASSSLNGIAMHAFNSGSGSLPRIGPQNDLEPEAKISGNIKSVKLSQDDEDIQHDNGCSGGRRDQQLSGGTDVPIQAGSPRSPQTNDKRASTTEEKGGNSQAQAAGAVPMNGGRSDETMERLVGLFREFLEAASNPGAGTSDNNFNPPHTQRNMAGRKRLFGLAKGSSSESGSNNRYDYEQKYPRDRFGEETAANARIWLTYLDEAEAFDRERVEGWKETVDVLLVFAGLFSGVITTFISQASQSLQQDNTRVTASLLFETVQILRAQFTGLPITNVPDSTITPTSPFTPSTNASLVNGLWFTSLAITLSTALFAVLAKQWLYYYMVSFSGTANAKVRARQLRFNGFEEWKVAAIVDLLPILLHLAVGLFLTGIMILLFPLDAHIAWTIVTITGITFTLYFVSVILPIRYPECPYTTSLTIYAGILFFALREIFHWISTVSNKGLQAVWKRMDFHARRTIERLIHYTLSFFRRLFMLISKLAGDVRHGLGRHRPRIFSGEFPKFTKWREENIKQAVENETFLDFQAVNWLYTASHDRSVHRIIARSVAVNPSITEHFGRNSIRALSRTLEVSRTNVLDLRYGLCLDFLSSDFYHPHWYLLKSIPDHVTESELEEAEYKTYLRLPKKAFGCFDIPGSGQLSLDCLIAGGDSVKLPLAMWCYLLKRMSRNRKMAARILKPQGLFPSLFHYSVDPTRELVDSAGLISFDSDELGWWKLEYLFDYFRLGKPDLSSETKSYATKYLLLITVYRQLTSNHPLITNKEKREKSLHHLFGSFRRCSTVPWTPEYRFRFFKEILCVDSFWSESMIDARSAAVGCLDPVWHEEVTFPYMDCSDLFLVYQWCHSQDHGLPASPIFTILFAPQNRHHLSTILLNDSKAVSNLLACLRNLRHCYHLRGQGRDMYPLLMDLLKSAKMSLFTILYDMSVLIQLWELISSTFKRDPEQFFLLVKSKLDREKLDELFTVMNNRAQSSRHTYGGYRLQASLTVFGQMIGRSPAVSMRSGVMLEMGYDYDDEERAQVPGPNERQAFRSITKWTKKHSHLWLKLFTGN